MENDYLQFDGDTSDKAAFYDFLATQTELLLGDERDFVANLANVAALLFDSLPEINWAGFYLLKNGELVLAPFQGKPACVRIAVGKGVCGTAAATRETVIVKNVHEFPGHIACDAASNSEIVVPLIKNDTLIGVLDIDAPIFNRFDDEDRKGLERIARILMELSEM